jgi:RNA polymerase sigma-70 factor (ECF subfamily)
VVEDALPNLMAATATQPELDRTLDHVYERRSSQMWSYARRLGLDAATAEDVMQEAFARALRGTGVLDLEVWLFRVVHNLAIDVLRLQGRVARPSLSKNVGEDLDERLALWEQVDQLPERQRAVIYLHYRVGFDFQTIAQILGITSGGARANAARAVTTLRSGWLRDEHRR